ncbi:MAG: serS [Frankiales bacterium]|nr:serS [Frankiales bacterium]
MIDLKLLRDDPDRVRASQKARGADVGLVDELLAADERRRMAVTAADTMRGEQKLASKAVASATADARPALLAKAKELALAVRDVEEQQAVAEAELRATMLKLPNIVEDGAPSGGEENSVEIERVGEIPSYDFEVLDHLALGEGLKAIDTERGAKVSGARFYYLTGVGALLEFALINMAMAQATEAGFTPVIAPALVKPAAMEGTGFLGAHSSEVYKLEADDLYLVGTSEVPLAAYHSDEILDVKDLPKRYVGFSSCFRREAGSYGKDTRGIIRVHQFDKVEMFSYCPPEQAHDEHLRLLGWEKEFLSKLELPFHVLDIAAGDLGSSAVRKFDCEVWLPSQNRWLELTSTSNCTEFQARRLNTRMRDEKGVRPVATLNGTLVAVTRTIVAILEVHQQADGSVKVPAALQPFLGGRQVLEPVR